MNIWQEAKQLNEKQGLIEMAKIGEIKNYTIIVWTNDNGNIPHFHIVDSNTLGKQFHTCVQIEKPEYFHHTGKEDTLNSKEKKELIKFFQASDPDEVFGTNWDVLLYEWNKNNNRKRISRDTEMPDYILLK